jgi:hypothetical protein
MGMQARFRSSPRWKRRKASLYNVRTCNEKGLSQMLKIETNIVNNRSVEDVFAVLSNPENNHKWSSAF